MGWLTSLPALLLLVTCPVMILLMVDALTRSHTTEVPPKEGPRRGRVIVMTRLERPGHESNHRGKRAA
jgi:hypothetical protein